MHLVSLNRVSDSRAFLEWDGTDVLSINTASIIFRSLATLVKEWYPFDDALVEKAVGFLQTISPANQLFSVDDFLFGLVPEHVDPVDGLIEATLLLLASSEHRIVESALDVFESTFDRCSTDNTLKMLDCNMISGVMTVIRPHTSSLSAGNVLHTRVIRLLKSSLFEARNLESFDISGSSRQSQMNDVIFERVLIPSETYLRYLCSNRYFVVEGQCLHSLLDLVHKLFEMSAFSSQVSDFVVSLPIALTITTPKNIVLWIDYYSFSKQNCAPVAPNSKAQTSATLLSVGEDTRQIEHAIPTFTLITFSRVESRIFLVRLSSKRPFNQLLVHSSTPRMSLSDSQFACKLGYITLQLLLVDD
ncbi:hypothetical protein BLNAU_23105 [Blattamonas nauphoetae]|uniref:Uncharacterized protein n=1 Tax=Blattamonas nauphoetae TaxID=2049346 RepID=A0ABQ9WTC9_9EUKA|nr:hypothetical protein BLNAU_23105 [Blattamonas nauphoetae]